MRPENLQGAGDAVFVHPGCTTRERSAKQFRLAIQAKTRTEMCNLVAQANGVGGIRAGQFNWLRVVKPGFPAAVGALYCPFRLAGLDRD